MTPRPTPSTFRLPTYMQRGWAGRKALPLSLLATLLGALLAALALPAGANAEVCPNAAYRSGPSASLPDCRVYEAVSTLSATSGEVYLKNQSFAGSTSTELPFELAPSGNAVAYVGEPLSEGSGSIGSGVGNSWVATRAPGGGWTAIDQQPPAYFAASYQGFSEDLSAGILDTCEEPLLAPEAPGGGYNVLYAHDTGQRGLAGYRALITAKPPARLPCGNGLLSFGSVTEGNETFASAPLYAGGTPDLSHALFEANDALTANVPPTGPAENDLYDNAGGALHAVNLLPGESEAEPDATFGSPRSAEHPSSYSHVISNDGSRIFWTDLKNGNLYVREDGARTVQLDAAEAGCASCEGGGGWYWTASGDGRRAFFTDCARLTEGSTAVPSAGCGEQPGLSTSAGSGPLGNDLYEWDEGRLTDLTVDHNASDPLGADVQGVIGASEDGEYVYFVARGVLTSEPNARGETAAPSECAPPKKGGLCNLYLRHAGVTTFIAALHSGDDFGKGESGNTYGIGDWQPDLGHRTAAVTPDGRGLAFVSDRSLTGYDNVVKGIAAVEVYIYDAEAGRLFCASCNPSGAPPAELHGEPLNPASDPTSLLPISANDTYLARWISDDGGRVFFDSREPLVPQDTNGLLDAYEWERDGLGSCHQEAGCVYLISGGRSTYGEGAQDVSELLGTSASGEDAFLITRHRLVPADHTELFELYDARVGGVGPPVPPSCTGTGCQGAPSPPPLFATPPSVTFDGTGNLEPPPAARPLTRAQKLARALEACAKKPKKRRARCRAQARKRYGRAGKHGHGKRAVNRRRRRG
jgi:WD40-like Beta Propeller Repeat